MNSEESLHRQIWLLCNLSTLTHQADPKKQLWQRLTVYFSLRITSQLLITPHVAVCPIKSPQSPPVITLLVHSHRFKLPHFFCKKSGLVIQKKHHGRTNKTSLKNKQNYTKYVKSLIHRGVCCVSVCDYYRCHCPECHLYKLTLISFGFTFITDTQSSQCAEICSVSVPVPTHTVSQLCGFGRRWLENSDNSSFSLSVNFPYSLILIFPSFP